MPDTQLRLYRNDDRPRTYLVRGPYGWVEIDHTIVDATLPRHPRTQKPHPNLQHWHAVRAIVLERDGWRCVVCSAGWDLEMHHRDGYDHWGYEEPEDLTTLCTDCHRLYEINKRLGRAA